MEHDVLLLFVIGAGLLAVGGLFGGLPGRGLALAASAKRVASISPTDWAQGWAVPPSARRRVTREPFLPSLRRDAGDL